MVLLKSKHRGKGKYKRKKENPGFDSGWKQSNLTVAILIYNAGMYIVHCNYTGCPTKLGSWRQLKGRLLSLKLFAVFINNFGQISIY